MKQNIQEMLERLKKGENVLDVASENDLTLTETTDLDFLHKLSNMMDTNLENVKHKTVVNDSESNQCNYKFVNPIPQTTFRVLKNRPKISGDFIFNKSFISEIASVQPIPSEAMPRSLFQNFKKA